METTNAVRNYGQAEAVQSVVRAVYHHWMTASPSKYPPNLHSRVESRDGAIVRRDYKKLVGIGIKEYKQFKACDAKYVELIWEFTPDGQALEKRMVVNFKIRSAHQTYWSFGSCNSCWKQGRRNFTDTDITGHPLQAHANDPNLPRLGRCGCVICNECVLELERSPRNKEKMDVHCPYCGNEECFSKHMRIWLVSEEVSNLDLKHIK
jgi:hypothetical protein